MKKTPLSYIVLIAAAIAAGIGSTPAQTSYFTNLAGGDWNTAANWDLDFLGNNVIPAEGTNANLASAGAVTVDYNSPMAATSFGSLTIDGGLTLNINATGFNQDLAGVGVDSITIGSGTLNVNSGGALTSTNGGPVTINAGGILNVSGAAYLAPAAAAATLNVNAGGRFDVITGGTATIADGGITTIAGTGALGVTGGSLRFTNSDTLTLAPGASLSVTNGVLDITNATSGVALLMGVNNNATATPFIIDGGTVNLSALLDIKGHASPVILYQGTLNCFGGSRVSEIGNDRDSRIQVNGGVANIGDFSLAKCRSTGGLIVSNGVVNATSLTIGYWNSQSFATIYGGFLTNTGAFTICDRTNGAVTSDRRPRFLIRGGTVVSTDAAGIIVANQANVTVSSGNYGSAGSLAGILDINAGLLFAEGITLVKDNTLTNAHAVLNLSGSGTIYLDSLGLIGNVGPTNSSYAVNMSGGTLAAKDNYSINANITLTGTAATFQTADAGGNPFDITANGVLSGSGVLNKTGAGTLSLEATNTYSGFTVISAGTLAIGAAGAIANTPKITVEAGAALDVSTAGNTILSGQTLAGSGTVLGSVVAQSGATISPGTSAGTLTFANGLNLQGGAVTAFELSDDPSGTTKTNDLISVTGDLDVSSGVSTILISALDASIPAGVYRLFTYGGNLIGSVANLNVTGVSGTLSNNATLKTIYVITTAVRGPANVTWVGNPGANDWDVLNTTNWDNAGSPDFFVPGDAVRFDALGAANAVVNLAEIVQPGSITVDAATDYTFTGSGHISGDTGLTKTNSGTLTMLTANDHTGITVLAGGVLETATLGNGGIASGLGAAPSGAANLVFNGGTLRYQGANQSTDRGATLEAGGGTIDVEAGATTLTVGGALTGAGVLTKAGAGTLILPVANDYAGGSVVSGGTFRVNVPGAAGTNAITLAGGTLLVTLPNDNDLLNPIAVTSASGLAMGNANNRINGDISGAENLALTINPGSVLTFNGDLTNYSGTFDLGASAGVFRFNSGGGNSTLGCPNATVDLGSAGGSLQARNAGTMNVGALRGGPGTFVRGQGSGSGTLVWEIGSSTNEPSTTFEGTIEDAAVGRLAALTKVGPGKLTLTGTNTYTGNTIVNEGTLQVDGAITATPFVTVFGGTLSGSGAIGGAVDVQANAVLSPGASIGQLTISNILTLQFGSTNIMEINKTAGTSDSVVGLQSVSYGGTLVVSNLAGSLAYGDTFKLFDSLPGTFFGAFDSIELPALGGDLFWDTSLLTVDGTIRVSMTGPLIQSFGFDGNNFFLTGTNGGNTSAQYVLLSATNVALPLANWTALVTNSFDGNGNFAVTNAVNPSEPQRFFLIRTHEEILSE